MAFLLILQELLIKERNGGSWSRNIHFNICETFSRTSFILNEFYSFTDFLQNLREMCVHIFKSKQTKLLTELKLIPIP